MVERTVGGRTAVEIVARRETIEKRHFESWLKELRANSPAQPSEPSEQKPAGFLETVQEVWQEYPFGFYSALIDLVRGRGEFAKKE